MGTWMGWAFSPQRGEENEHSVMGSKRKGNWGVESSGEKLCSQPDWAEIGSTPVHYSCGSVLYQLSLSL